MTKDNGGSAFPYKHDWPNEHVESDHGMTLRDYFAAKAMQGLMSSGIKPIGFANLEDLQSFMSQKSYEYADAMLEARKS